MVIACAGCYRTITKDYKRFYASPTFEVLHFTELALKLLKERKLKFTGEMKAKVTYHDPCHLRFGLGVSEEPRRLLSACAELEATPDEDKCCGGGGSFAFFNPEMSASLARRKVEDARGSDAAALVTACPGCMMQLREHFSRAGLHRPVLHLADVLAGRFTER